MRQYSSVYSLCTQNIRVKYLDNFLRRECLNHTNDQMARIVHDDIQASLFLYNRLNCTVSGVLGEYIQLQRFQVKSVCRSVIMKFLGTWSVATRNITHACIHRMSSCCQRSSGKVANSSTCTSYKNYILVVWIHFEHLLIF
ncbi:hypothetical protein D3C75_839490 [compost metagenome]